MGIHPTAAVGYAAVAGAYERGRPDYPGAAVSVLLDAIGVGAGRDVVEVGAGTGKFTRHLVEAGASLIAVEPIDEMRSVLRSRFPSVDLRAGTAESLPVGSSSVDAVVCAQSFHWFRLFDALREFHRVLRPAGWLGLIWNVRDDRAPLSRGISLLLEPHRGSTPRYKTGEWMEPFGRFPGFGPLEHRRFEWVAEFAKEALVDRVMSVSCVAVLPQERRNEVAAEVLRLIDRLSEKRGGGVVLPHVTDVYWSARRDAT